MDTYICPAEGSIGSVVIVTTFIKSSIIAVTIITLRAFAFPIHTALTPVTAADLTDARGSVTVLALVRVASVH